MKKAYTPIQGSVAEKVLTFLRASRGHTYSAKDLAEAIGVPFETINRNIQVARRDGALRWRLEGRSGYFYWLEAQVAHKPNDLFGAPVPPAGVEIKLDSLPRFMVGVHGRSLIVEKGINYIEFTPDQARQIAAACSVLLGA